MTKPSTALPPVPRVQIGDGVGIPQLGFGVWQIEDDAVEAALSVAFEAGYRHVDTARIYGNEAGVGRALAASDVPRSEVFVTTKLWNDDQPRARALRAFHASLSRLGLEAVDLYLIHWPVPRADRYVEAWRTLIELRDAGLVRAIGVCNFGADHLQRLLDETGEVPCLNQVELHPYFQQTELVRWHETHGVVTQAWSPLGQGGPLLQDPVVAAIATKHGVTPGQVVIRWHLQRRFVVIPKSVTPARIHANIDVFGFTLDADDLASIAALDQGASGRLGPDPATFNHDAPR